MNISLRSFFAFALLLVASDAPADPALWKIRHDGATIYLFGTVHVLPKTVQWRYPALDRALAASGVLYVELVDDNPATMQPLILQYGIDMQHPLSSEIDVGDEQRVQAAAQTAGVPPQTLEMMRPWMAALTMTVAPLLKAGFDPESGVDRALRRDFAAAGKSVLGLETASEQIHFFADMSMPAEIAFLRSTLDDFSNAASELNELVKDWRTGDVDAIARLETVQMRDKYPAVYQTLLVERNRYWAQRIAGISKQPGTVFIAVGAAHLAGPDSVQAQLRKLGVETTQLH